MIKPSRLLSGAEKITPLQNKAQNHVGLPCSIIPLNLTPTSVSDDVLRSPNPRPRAINLDAQEEILHPVHHQPQLLQEEECPDWKQKWNNDNGGVGATSYLLYYSQ